MEHATVADEALQSARDLTQFVDASPTPFHAVESIRCELDRAGFSYVSECDRWHIQPNRGYYTTRNDSSIIAFRVGEHVSHAKFHVVAAHVDSPALRIKPCPELCGPETYVRLNVEAYGSTIDRTWLDRPLSVAGRVVVREGGRIVSKLFSAERDLLIIPSVAIHLNRKINESGPINRQVDMCPLYSAGALSKGSFDKMLADGLGIEAQDILGRDLIVCNRQPAIVWGLANEFVSAPRLDDLACAYAAMRGLTGSSGKDCISVLCCLDSEEVGSQSMQGARSSFVESVLRRVCDAMGADAEGFRRALAQSFVMSCDNAQALHPNHPELSDEVNRVMLNKGIAVKEAASGSYSTNAMSRAIFEEICSLAEVPVQYCANRSDIPCGSTIGNMLASLLGVHTVDVGLGQLAMHSSFETAGVADVSYLIRAAKQLFDARLTQNADGSITV